MSHSEEGLMDFYLGRRSVLEASKCVVLCPNFLNWRKSSVKYIKDYIHMFACLLAQRMGGGGRSTIGKWMEIGTGIRATRSFFGDI